MLSVLKRNQILNERDVTKITRTESEEDKSTLLFDIFYQHRQPEDVRIFCRLLQKSGVRASEEFGKRF